MEMNNTRDNTSILPNIPGIHQQEGFLLAIPESFMVNTADGRSYNLEVAEILTRDECVYNLYTTVENYQDTLEKFVNTDTSKLISGVSVLVIYHDEELGLYSTLNLWVNLAQVLENEDAVLEPADTERMVMVFKDFVDYLSTGKFRLE